MKYSVRFMIKEVYGTETYHSVVEEDVSHDKDKLSWTKVDMINFAFDQYKAQLDDGFLPLMPDHLKESQWNLGSTSLNYYGIDEDDGYDAVITLTYEDKLAERMLWEEDRYAYEECDY